MKSLPSELSARLSSGVTTLANAWVLTRRDGLVLGFTDHDRDLAVDGSICSALTGFTATAATRSLGFSVGNEEVDGALSSAAITDADLDAGLWDGAQLTVYLVDWLRPDLFVKLRGGELGEITRADSAFKAEVRGAATKLDAVRGRLFTRTCDADLADSRCGVALASVTASATVTGGDGVAVIEVSGLDGYAAGWFSGGRATVTPGASSGIAFDIGSHATGDGAVVLAPWRTLGARLEAGATLNLVAGCDKTFATCKAKFSNSLNFRGFPHIPGNDFVLSAAASTDTNDGSVLFE